MQKLKNIIDTWNMIEKYEINGYISENGAISIPEAEFERLLASVKNRKYILNLKA